MFASFLRLLDVLLLLFFFFFQAEDGIRDLYVTGVQTCALPIYNPGRQQATEVGAQCGSGAGSGAFGFFGKDNNLAGGRSEEHTSELQSRRELVCRLLLEKKKFHMLLRRSLKHIGPSSVPVSCTR